MINAKRTQKWQTLWGISTAPTTSPLVIRKSLKGRSTEAPSVGPLNAVIYQPLESSGRYWARHWLTSQPNGGSTPSAARIQRATYSELFPSTVQVPPNTGAGQTVNRNSGTQAYAATVEIAANSGVDRTESGAGWVTTTTGAQVPVTRRSSTVGDSVTYTITGVTRIHWRAYMNLANGGRVSAVVLNAGNPISDAQYIVGPEGSTRTVSLAYTISSFDNTTIGQIPIAKGLNPALTYTVTLTLSSGARIYDSGLLGYVDADDRDGYAYDTLGVHGLWNNYTSFGNNKYQACFFAGSRAVYLVTNATRIDWKYVQRANGGRAGFKIYDTSGNDLTAYFSPTLATSGSGDRYVDTFNASTSEQVVTIADGMPLGTYYLHVWSLPSKSNAFVETAGNDIFSSAWLIADGGPTSYNSTIGGTVGVDTFADTDRQFLGGNANELDGAGNYVWAGQVRDSGDPNISAISESAYTTGVHGAESYPTNYVVTVDGVVLSWAAAADQTQWTGSVIVIEFDTLIYTQTNPATNSWAIASYRYQFDRFGIVQSFTIQTTRPIYRGIWYTGMAIAGNDAVSFTAQNSSITVTPTVGAVYLNGLVANTVVQVIVGGSTTVLICTATTVPTANSGTLTKQSGTGDATFTFTASSAPIHLGTGFKNVLLEPAVTQAVDVSIAGLALGYVRPHRGAAFWTNEGYCVAIDHTNPGEIWSEWDQVANATYYFERSRTAKTYCIVVDDSTGQTTGTLLGSGYNKTWVSRTRLFIDGRIPALLSN